MQLEICKELGCIKIIEKIQEILNGVEEFEYSFLVHDVDKVFISIRLESRAHGVLKIVQKRRRNKILHKNNTEITREEKQRKNRNGKQKTKQNKEDIRGASNYMNNYKQYKCT